MLAALIDSGGSLGLIQNLGATVGGDDGGQVGELLALERKRQKALRRQMGLSSGKEGLGAATMWKPPEVN